MAAFLKRWADVERAADIRAGLVAATVINVNRRKGARLVQPEDFFPSTQKQQHMTPEQGKAVMARWARAQNQDKSKGKV